MRQQWLDDYVDVYWAFPMNIDERLADCRRLIGYRKLALACRARAVILLSALPSFIYIQKST